jgi:hypothetical protein
MARSTNWPRPAHVAAVLLAFIATACGGGGGGGSSSSVGVGSGGGGSPPGSGGGSLQINSSNAQSSASRVLKAADDFGILVESITYYAYQLRSGLFNAGRMEDCDNGGELTYVRGDANGSMTLDTGDTIVVTIDDCDGRNGDIFVTVNQLVGEIDSFVGTVIATIELSNGNVFSGSFSFSFSQDAASARWDVSNASFSSVYSGGGDTFTSFRYVKEVVPATHSITFSGAVNSTSLGGSVSFDTPTALAASRGIMPADGTLSLTASGSAARVSDGVGPDDARIDVDTDGDGQLEDSITAEWADLFEGRIFEVAFPAIDASAISFSPDIPIGGRFIRIDPNYVNRYPRSVDAIAYAWSVNGVPAVGETGEYLSKDVIRRGDLLEGTVTLTDGINTVDATHTATVGNAPPSIQGLDLLPEEPFTTDTIVVSSNATDPDEDFLQYSYEWFRNGEVIAGQTGNALPPSEHLKGDELEVTITVSDGIDSRSVRVGEVTIQDSPPALDVIQAPASINFGDLVTFTVNLSDADNDPVDPFDFYLETAPTGMTIDPTSGAVNWTPGGPMFLPERDVFWSVGSSGVTDDFVTGSIRVMDPNRDYPLMRVGGYVGRVVQDQMRLGDFDNDGTMSLLVATEWGAFEHAWNGAGFQPVWSHPFAVGSGNGPPDSIAVADLDNDGYAEVFLSDDGAIVRLDGLTRQIDFELPLAADEACLDMEVADLTNDGADELICAMSSSFDAGHGRLVVVFDAVTLIELWRADEIYLDKGIAVGNVDADPQLEIVHGYGKVYDGLNATLQWDFHAEFGHELGVAVTIADADSDGLAEIIAYNSFKVSGYDAATHAVIWEIDIPLVHAILLADIDPMPGSELVLSTGFEAGFYVYSFDGGGFNELYQIDSLPTDYRLLAAGDVDNDGGIELVASPGSEFLVLGFNPGPEIESPVAPYINRTAIAPFRGGYAIDDGDGTKSLLFVSESSPYFDLARLSPDTGAVSEHLEPGYIGEADGEPTIAVGDYDCDSSDGVMLATTIGYYAHFVAFDHLAETIDWRSFLPDPPPIGLSQDFQTDVVAFDLTGDGCDELVAFNEAGRLQVFDILHQAEIWSSQTSAGGGQNIEIADLEGDGDVEVIVAYGRQLEVLDVTTNPFALVSRARYQTPADLNFRFVQIDLGDSDDDGVLEIFAHVRKSTNDPSSIYRFDEDLNLISSVETTFSALEMLFDDASPPPHRNVLLGSGSAIAAFDVHSGEMVWHGPGLIGRVSPQSLNFVDFEDGVGPRLSIGSETGMIVTR